MIFAFSPLKSSIPHFTLDAITMGEGSNAFHLDLIPRVDMGAHLKYMDYMYGPITASSLSC